MNRPLQTVPRVYRFDVLMFIGFTALGATALAAETAMTPPVVELPGAKSHIFKEVTGGALRLFIFTPPDHKPADARPALVLFFGGGWERGYSVAVRPAGRVSHLARHGRRSARVSHAHQPQHDAL